MGKFGIFIDHRESGPRFNVSSEGFMIAFKKKNHELDYGDQKRDVKFANTPSAVV